MERREPKPEPLRDDGDRAALDVLLAQIARVPKHYPEGRDDAFEVDVACQIACLTFRGSRPQVREHARHGIAPDVAWTFGLFGYRCATVVIRSKKLHPLIIALVAQALAGLRAGDVRDTHNILWKLKSAAEEVGLPYREHFVAAAELAGPTMAELLRECVQS